ncbi:RidA family protein [Campylobacter canadensis]|uniref:RidA family protein n=1 Tax=Campylobacter canadensis TaxID=449520 RepID=A0ABS7WRJ6_9BACT|nr:RidA family protein [Campylobacter canadensis]MBZ7987163.1 RidA family protein [Campylobacter canadensis]MBZ7994483.1 RidA family protein [Campylobacter canadensis]MBZ7996430.1 RidA family protein [Campylobacter canadensis]MBZ7998213.1 RidA family protein [Campylobacter canadensis]MBZ7999802.1 RidA family protein [Campylobacter canadensis]
MNYPKAIGPYSVSTSAKDLVFVSGQLPINPSTGDFASNDIKELTKQSLKNIEEILKEQGLSMQDVVKTTILLADINDFASVNEVYAEFFKEPFPARSAYAVLALPKNARIEIEAIALKKS